ncbi:MAG: SufE family protein [Flammeovirgaceae bacterium]
MKNIADIQQEIIDEFSLLDGDQEMTLYYLMELGQKLPALDNKEKTELNEVKGCQSKVWLTANLDGDKLMLSADSNTAITKGLVSLLVRIFSGQKPDEVLSTELTFMKSIGMERFIGTQRSNGFAAMVKQIKLYALAYKTQLAG